jgi:hypothetical protein
VILYLLIHLSLTPFAPAPDGRGRFSDCVL